MSDSPVLIHLVFLNDGTVVRMSETPDNVSPQAWFNHLSQAAADDYQPLSGGRGVFRLTADQLVKLKAPFAANHHALN